MHKQRGYGEGEGAEDGLKKGSCFSKLPEQKKYAPKKHLIARGHGKYFKVAITEKVSL